MEMENKEHNKFKIEGVKKQNSFTTPDGYFNEFPLRMQELLGKKQEKGFSFTFSVQRPKLILAYALASLAILISSIWVLNNINNSNQKLLISNEEIAQIIDYEIMGYDEFMIIDEFIESGADFSNLDKEISEYDFSVEDIDLENILNEL